MRFLNYIIESYKNEAKPSDGEVFRKIRLYHREGNKKAEEEWWTRIENSKPKDLRQLLSRGKNKHGMCLSEKFDALIDMPGLWTRFQFGSLHRLLVLKCDEVLLIHGL